MEDASAAQTGPLVGLKVVEFAQIIAGPLAGTLMADLGAEVVHVEPPGTGDAHRNTGAQKDGVSLWWKAASRNKRCITLDLRGEAGQAIAHRLVAEADVAIVTMRASTLERWRLDWESLRAVNPRLVLLQVSGFGAETSRRDDPGFGKVGEARSGTVHLTGFPDGPPVHAGFSHGDSTTAVMGAFGVMAALHRRSVDPDFAGERVDLALSDALYRICDWQVVYWDQLGRAPMRAGNQLANAPAAVINTYRTRDDAWVTITSATLRSVLNVVRMIALDESAYETWEQQRAARDEIDAALRDWVAERSAEEVLAALREHSVTGERVFSMDDIATDPVLAEREAIVELADSELGTVRMQGVVPRLTENPGRVCWTGPALGADNADVYASWLGLTADEVTELTQRGVI